MTTESTALPADLTLDRLTHLVRPLGDWLREQRPTRALPDIASMQAKFDFVSGHVQASLENALSKYWPAIPFSKAEFDERQQTKPEWPVYWVCDALDGAVQYLSGLPLWTLTLCLIVDGKPHMALVFDPMANSLYRAQAGHGADCNGEPLQCLARSDMAAAVIGTSFPNYPQRPKSEADDFTQRLAQVIPHVFAQRWMGPGSLSLAQLAAGALDGYWENGHSVYDWWAGALIAQEAGVRLTDLDGQPFGWCCNGILAATPAIYAELKAAVQV